ncbi:DUF1572 family protein [Flavobacterium oreochromis]|uniref:DUF1572 domain-containing protein n=2 Tax=Flavobacterium TaxID=237 RepID=A0A246GA75_9FLAO|nr:DUF1572 family protein [Flavobacterium oreochromis]OWP76769.1 hypothetical protein BWK62_09055 [Flavobacterium oreochromis]OWP78058.1 hypothetical protein BWG23_03380 [Flavobacterium oreochromis]POR24081.1 hypothetical protein BWK58_08680 [Flavobacterium columnare]QYS85885.1 DUF1572 family protein [Flavobacterium oreochromis]
MEITNSYLGSIKKQMLYYKTIADKAIEQLEPQQLFITSNEDTNSIAIIIKHIAGNMISRWTDFLTSDGEKEWRNRDDEFENKIATKEELLILWEKGWKCYFNAINSLNSENLNQIIYIRNEEHTIIDAMNRQLAHYPYHIGQIVFYAKMLKNGDWDNLSIAKNQSKEYNTLKFSNKNISQTS